MHLRHWHRKAPTLEAIRIQTSRTLPDRYQIVPSEDEQYWILLDHQAMTAYSFMRRIQAERAIAAPEAAYVPRRGEIHPGHRAAYIRHAGRQLP